MVEAGINPKHSSVEPEVILQTIAPGISINWPLFSCNLTKPEMSFPCNWKVFVVEFWTKKALLIPSVLNVLITSAFPEFWPVVPIKPTWNGTLTSTAWLVEMVKLNIRSKNILWKFKKIFFDGLQAKLYHVTN